MTHPYPAGTRVEKVATERGDINPDGTKGYVIYMVPGVPERVGKTPPNTPAYFVLWDVFPVPVAIMATRVQAVDEPPMPLEQVRKVAMDDPFLKTLLAVIEARKQ